MKVKVNFPNSVGRRMTLKAHLDRFSNFTIDFVKAESRLVITAEKARELVNAGSDYIVDKLDSNENSWVRKFNDDETLVKWFGEVDKKSQVKDVLNRMEGLRKRFNRTLTIRVRPHTSKDIKSINDGKGFTLAKTIGAINIGSGTFTVYPMLMTKEFWDVSETMVHEIGHHWFMDQKLGSTTVYGEDKALDLAIYDPKKARKSPENYAVYCNQVHPLMGYGRKFKGYFKRLD